MSSFPSAVEIIKVGGEYPEAGMLSAVSGQDIVTSLIMFLATSRQTVWVDVVPKAGIKRSIPCGFRGATGVFHADAKEESHRLPTLPGMLKYGLDGDCHRTFL